MATHHPYGLWHLGWLAGIAAASAGAAFVCRRGLIPSSYIRAALVFLLAGGELMRLTTDRVRFPDTLPLNLCNISAWVAVLACWRLAPLAVEFTYFAGISGAAMAMLTPDLGVEWPLRFFVNHGALIVAASALVYGRLSPLRPGAVWRAYGFFALYVGLIAWFDWKFKVNYAYLRTKPKIGTVMDLLGPWPWYLLGAGGVGLGLFGILWLVATKDGHRLLADEAVSRQPAGRRGEDRREENRAERGWPAYAEFPAMEDESQQ
jgi:hypothetical integral membrane protein (TIGR02206 family)